MSRVEIRAFGFDIGPADHSDCDKEFGELHEPRILSRSMGMGIKMWKQVWLPRRYWVGALRGRMFVLR